MTTLSRAGVLLAASLVLGGEVQAATVPIDPGNAASAVAMDYDAASGNYLAIIRSGVDWSLHLSTNGGASWTETFLSDNFLISGMVVDLEVQGGYAYVVSSFEALNGSSVAHIRRFDASTGAYDDSWGSHTVHSTAVNEIDEIGLAITDTGTIFYVLLLNNGVVLCYIGQTGNGASWATEPTLISDADRGLDVSHPPTWEIFSDSVLLYVSFVSTTSVVSLSRLHQDWNFSTPVTVANQAAADRTSVASEGRDVVVAWEYQGTGYQGVRSRHAEERSAQTQSWTWWPMWESGSGHYYDPLVAALDTGSNRNAMVYESGTEIFLRENTDWIDNWGDAIVVNEHAFTAGMGHNYAFEWMGDGFGLAYIDSGGEVRFYHPKLVLFADGFESGNTSAWSSTLP